MLTKLSFFKQCEKYKHENDCTDACPKDVLPTRDKILTKAPMQARAQCHLVKGYAKCVPLATGMSSGEAQVSAEGVVEEAAMRQSE